MTYVEIPIWRLAIALGLMAIAIALSKIGKLGLESSFALGTVRAAVQLVAIGYALRLVFDSEHWAVVLGVVLVMTAVAAWTSASRVEHGPGRKALVPRAGIAIVIGSLVALVPVFALIIPPKPWFEARYVIPISGMMLSNGMNVVAQIFERIFNAARIESALIEDRLALGATPEQALASIVRAALRSALIPTVNALMTVGLVALPGMMTGQIVSGTAPEQAVRYQLVIMYQLVAVSAVSGFIAAVFARRLLFNPDGQLAGS